ncbi:MAG: putative sugar O-methyltransferase [Candidatus Paracaedibacter sp.]
MSKYSSNSLWNSIGSLDSFTNFDIDNFKNNRANNRMVQYSIETHSMLFFKNILFQMANSLGRDNLNLLQKIPNRHIGGGINLHYEGMTFDLDYLLSLEEVLFLKDTLQGISTILEIGPGYGRTCHSILALYKNIQEYVIVDLKEMLGISQKYLKKVLNKNDFEKITFIEVDSLDLNDNRFDLVINIDSMQEMDEDIVHNYLKFINDKSIKFYTKNTLGKFDPSLFGWEKTQNAEMALNSGILKEVINIFCSKELSHAQNVYLEKFCPSSLWRPEKHSTSLPWSHYYQALYTKVEP